MIYELFGMPGCGKSTYLRKKSINAGVVAGSANSGIKKIIKSLLLFSPFALLQKKRWYSFIDDKIKYSSIIGCTSRNYLNRIILLISVYHYVRKDVYVDEGVIHRIITYTIAFNLDEKKMLLMIKMFIDAIDDINITYLCSTPTQSYEAIKKRDRHECSFDELDDDEIYAYLERYYSLADIVLTNFRSKIFVMENGIYE